MRMPRLAGAITIPTPEKWPSISSLKPVRAFGEKYSEKRSWKRLRRPRTIPPREESVSADW